MSVIIVIETFVKVMDIVFIVVVVASGIEGGGVDECVFDPGGGFLEEGCHEWW